jgi:hypothetical protein
MLVGMEGKVGEGRKRNEMDQEREPYVMPDSVPSSQTAIHDLIARWISLEQVWLNGISLGFRRRPAMLSDIPQIP